MSNKTKTLFIGILVVLGVLGLIVIMSLPVVQGTPIAARSNGQEVSSSNSLVSDYIISADQAFQLRDNGAYLLDIRTVEEWDQTHIPGAFLIPLDQLQARNSELPGDQDIVIYCRSGNRSAQALNILLNAGFSNVYSMDGGINNWINTGYPVECIFC